MASSIQPFSPSTSGGVTVATGAMIYNETTNKLNFYNGSSWEAVTSA